MIQSDLSDSADFLTKDKPGQSFNQLNHSSDILTGIINPILKGTDCRAETVLTFCAI